MQHLKVRFFKTLIPQFLYMEWRYDSHYYVLSVIYFLHVLFKLFLLSNLLTNNIVFHECHFLLPYHLCVKLS